MSKRHVPPSLAHCYLSVKSTFHWWLSPVNPETTSKNNLLVNLTGTRWLHYNKERISHAVIQCVSSECVLVQIYLSCPCTAWKHTFKCCHVSGVLPTVLGSQQAALWQHLRVSGIYLHFDGYVVSCTHGWECIALLSYAIYYVEIIICKVHCVTIVYLFWAIYLNCATCFWQCWDLSSCVLYQQRSSSWCRTDWVFLAPESRSCCRSRPGRPKTWSETPKSEGTGCKAGPEYSNKQKDNKNWNTREVQSAPTASSSLLLNMTCKFNFFHCKLVAVQLPTTKIKLSLSPFMLHNKLYFIMVVGQILLYLLPNGNMRSRLWLGWVLSFSILWVLCHNNCSRI